MSKLNSLIKIAIKNKIIQPELPKSYKKIISGNLEKANKNIFNSNGDGIFSFMKKPEYIKWSEKGKLMRFAEDTFGNSLAFDYRKTNKNPKIVHLDHEYIPHGKITLVANSFDELVRKGFSDVN